MHLGRGPYGLLGTRAAPPQIDGRRLRESRPVPRQSKTAWVLPIWVRSPDRLAHLAGQHASASRAFGSAIGAPCTTIAEHATGTSCSIACTAFTHRTSTCTSFTHCGGPCAFAYGAASSTSFTHRSASCAFPHRTHACNLTHSTDSCGLAAATPPWSRRLASEAFSAHV